MLRKVYVVTAEYYNYFGNSKEYVDEYNTPKEVINALKKDFDYGDAFWRTKSVKLQWRNELEEQRPHARSKKEWENIIEERNKITSMHEEGWLTRKEFENAFSDSDIEDTDTNDDGCMELSDEIWQQIENDLFDVLPFVCH